MSEHHTSEHIIDETDHEINHAPEHTSEHTPEQPRNWQAYAIGAVALIASALIYSELSTNNEKISATTKCIETWDMNGAEHGKTEWLKSGITDIVKENNNDPRTALYGWLDKIDNDQQLLAYFANNLHAKNKDNTKNILDSSLISVNGCATDSAKKELESIKSILKTAIVSFDTAPSNGINSVVNNNTVKKTNESTIKGDKSSIKITLPNGNSLWILNICGNLVINKPYIPKNTPKSNKSADYKQPGTDNKKDSGNELDTTKNVVTEKAEKTPPKVVAIDKNIIDTKNVFSGYVSSIQ